jgi:hypothetical protein
MPASIINTSREQKSQPWKNFWPPQDVGAFQANLTPEQENMQRSYGTHASNTKGRIFHIDSQTKCKCTYIDMENDDANMLLL